MKRREMFAHLDGCVMEKHTGYFRLLVYKPPKHQTMKKSKDTTHNHHWET